MSLPLVSIVIPMYNQRPEFLKQCIESAINQTYTNIEIVISDNHSTNEAPEMLKTFRDSRIRIVQPPEHLPMTPNFQWASEQAKGKYISFLPSDDWFEKGCIEEMVKAIEPHPGAVMAFCNVKQYYNDIKAPFISFKAATYPSDVEIVDYIRMTKMKGCLVGSILLNSVYQKIGGIGHGQLTFASDRWLLIQMAMHGDGVYTEYPGAVFRNENPMRINRIFNYSIDVAKLFDSLLEESYPDKIKGLQKVIYDERNIMAYGFLKGMALDNCSTNPPREEFLQTLDNVGKIGKTKTIHLMIRLYKIKPFLWAFSVWFYLVTKFNNALFKIKNLFKK